MLSLEILVREVLRVAPQKSDWKHGTEILLWIDSNGTVFLREPHPNTCEISIDSSMEQHEIETEIRESNRLDDYVLKLRP